MMNASRSTNRQCMCFTLYPSYENVHAVLADINIFVFRADGSLIDSQSIRRGKSRIAVNVMDLQTMELQLVLAPAVELSIDAFLTLEAARAGNVFETCLKLEDGQSSYILDPVPETIWRRWLLNRLTKKFKQWSEKKGCIVIW